MLRAAQPRYALDAPTLPACTATPAYGLPVVSRTRQAATLVSLSTAAITATAGLALTAPAAVADSASTAQASAARAAQPFSTTAQADGATTTDADGPAAARAKALGVARDQAATGPQNPAFDNRRAGLGTSEQAVRQYATNQFVARFTAQEQARKKNNGKTPAGTVTDGLASIIYPGGVPANPTYVNPVPDHRYAISAGFGATGIWVPYHTGQDFAAPTGTPVVAITDAIVGAPLTDSWPGTHVVLHFADGTSVVYAHLNDATVKPGQLVKAGELIGHVGNTGNSFGSHLHLDLSPKGTIPGDFYASVDPRAWLASHGVQI